MWRTDRQSDMQTNGFIADSTRLHSCSAQKARLTRGSSIYVRNDELHDRLLMVYLQLRIWLMMMKQDRGLMITARNHYSHIWLCSGGDWSLVFSHNDVHRCVISVILPPCTSVVTYFLTYLPTYLLIRTTGVELWLVTCWCADAIVRYRRTIPINHITITLCR